MKKRIQSLSMILILALLCGLLAGCGSFDLGVRELHMKLGQASQIPLELKDLPATYESSDPSVVTVSDSGLIVPVAEGSSTITVTNGKGKSSQCTVIVDRVEPTGLRFKPDSSTLTPNETVKPKLVFEPNETTYFAVSYASDNESVATVDADGTIHAAGVGEARIIATAENGVAASCSITVRSYAESISMKPTLEMESGDTMDLDVVTSPIDSQKENMTWKSSDDSVAKVSNGRVTAVNAGTATISVTTEVSGLTAKCEVTVVPTEFQIFNVATNITHTGDTQKYETDYNITVFVKGGIQPYSYKFDVLQANKETSSTGWISTNGFHGNASGTGTCVARVTVKDASGKTLIENYDLLQ